jgi:hypothetical protein
MTVLIIFSIPCVTHTAEDKQTNVAQSVQVGCPYLS